MHPLTWNANREPAGRTVRGLPQYRTDFHVKWVNYLADSRTWMPIDMRLSPRVNVYEMRKAPFQAELPVMSNGQALFAATNRYSIKDKIAFDEPTLDCLIRPIGPYIKNVVGDLQGDKVVYVGAYGDYGDYILQTYHGRTPRLRKLVSIKKAPPRDIDLEFEIEIPDLFDFASDEIMERWDGREIPIRKAVHFLKRGSTLRGMGFTRPRIWDSNPDLDLRKQEFVNVSIRLQAGRLILTKHIPVSFFDNAVFPVFTDTDFYPDPDPESTTVDGKVGEDNTSATWATIIGAAGDHFDSTQSNTDYWASRSHETTSDRWVRNRRFIALFNTAAIPDADVISAASFIFWPTSLADANFWTATHDATHLCSSAPASNTALANGDYDSLGSTSFGSILYANVTTGQYNTIALNAAGIAAIVKDGITKLGIKSGADILAETPAWSSGVDDTELIAYSADQAGTANDEYLSVTHTAPIVTLTADAGSYAVTGTASSLLKHSRLSAEAGNYSLTGTAATLARRFTLAAAAGAYAITGTAATLLKHWKLSAGAGSYTLTGQTAALKKMWKLAAGAGSYALTGQTAALKKIWKLAAGVGTYAITGVAVTFNYIHMWAEKTDPSTIWTEKTDPSGIWTEKTDPSTSFSEKTDSSTEWTEKTDPSSTWT